MKFKKLGALILGAILTIGVAAGLGTSFESNKAEAALSTTSEELSCSKGTVSNNTMSFSTTSFNIVHAKGSGSNFAAYMPWRVYSKNTVKISSKNSTTKIGKVEIVHSSTYYSTISSDIGTVTMATSSGGTTTWTVAESSAKTSVTFTITGTAQSRWTKIKIYPITETLVQATNLTINATATSVYSGEEITITPTLSGGSGNYEKTITWESSNTNVIAAPADSEHGSSFTIAPKDVKDITNVTLTGTVVSPGSATNSIVITVNPKRTLIGVTLAGDMTKKEYNVGDSWDLSGLYLDLSYSVGDNEQILLTDLTAGEDYILSDDNASGTSITSLYIYGEYEDFDFEGTITGIEVTKATFDVLNRAFTGITDTSYTSWSGKTGTTGVVYAGQSAGGNDSIQLRSNNSNSGVISTTNDAGYVISKVTLIWNSSTANGRTVNVYGSNTPYTNPTNLYSSDTDGDLLGTIVCGTSTELSISGNYKYIGLRSASSALYLSEIKIDYKEAATLKSIEVTTNPTKTIYSVGEDFDPTGMEITASYSDGSTKNVVIDECTFSPDVIAENTTKITISYKGITCELPITLKAVKNVTGLASMPNVYVGDTVDAGQFELNVEYNDGTTGTVQADEVNLDTTTAGVKEATATYNGASNTKTITFEVEVYGLTSLSWTNRGDHVAFVGSTLGEVFKTTEWKFTAKYNDENKTQLEPSPVFGTGENDVRVSLYEKGNPTEENTPLDVNYEFTLEDDGKYLVASYKGIFSSSNHRIDIVEELNAINKDVSVQTEGKAIAFNLGDDGEPPHKDGSTAKATYSETSDDYTLSITGGEKMYPSSFDAAGNGAIKLGTTSAAGRFSFTVPEGIIKVDIHAAKYKANAATLDINGVKYVLTKNSNDGAYDVIQIDTSTTKTITLEVTSGYRAMVNSIVFYTAGQTTTQTINYANKNLMAQAAVMEFVNFFNTTMTADGACSVDGTTDYNSDTFIAAWELVANKWNELFGENTTLSSDDLAYAKEMFVYADSHWESEELDTDPLQRAMRTYDKVTSNTNLSKFIEGRPRVEDNGTGIKALLDNNASTIAAIVILAVITGFAFLFVSKRKQRKIEL